MLKISWKRGEIVPEEQFLLLFTMFCYLMLDFCVRTRVRFSLRDKRLFEITEVEIMRVDCNCLQRFEKQHCLFHIIWPSYGGLIVFKYLEQSIDMVSIGFQNNLT